MKLMVLILNKTDALENLLEGMSAAGLAGATIIESSGLATTLSRLDSSFISSSIRSILSGTEEDNLTILSVIRNDQLEIARKVIYNTVGDLSTPNTGILFTVPIDFVEGTRKNRSAFEQMVRQEDQQIGSPQQEQQEIQEQQVQEKTEEKQKKHKLFGKKDKAKQADDEKNS